MKWKSLLQNKCPLCKSLLEENYAKHKKYGMVKIGKSCTNEDCLFIIGNNKFFNLMQINENIN